MKYFALFFSLLTFYSCEQTIQEVEIADEEQDQSNTVYQNPEVTFSCSYAHLSDEQRTPRTISEAVDLINLLPKPLELPCFLRALKRPFKINLTDSKLSAQPAFDRQSPRVFIFIDDFIMSVTVDGNASNLLEFGEKTSGQNALRGEIAFPLQDDISHDLPFENIYRPISGVTSCSGCHKNEQAEGSGFSNQILKPQRKIAWDDFDYERYLCQVNNDNAGRCRMIRALMAYGETIDFDFPQQYPTMFESF